MQLVIPNVLVIFLGLCIGSFLNVCIYRLPERKSIVRPRSMCPACGYMIPFYDNIPVVSYILLRARCRSCGIPISIRYPLVETITGMFAFTVVYKFGYTPESIVNFIFICVLIVVTYIDIDHQIIPDRISLPGIPVFFLASFLKPSVTVYDSLIGIFLGGGSLYFIAWIYFLLKKRDGMGGGDIKLLAMIGAFIGWQGVLFTIFMSSALGAATGIALMISQALKRFSEKKNTEPEENQASESLLRFRIPYGPFLSIGAIVYLFFGAEIINWYLFNY